MAKSPKKNFIIPIFIPHEGCPHQCVFCNQTIITGSGKVHLTSEFIHSNIREFLSYNHKSRKVQISFYGGTFLGLEVEIIKMLLTEASYYVESGQVDSIRFSTRPDSISESRIDIIREFPVETIELGAQSMDNRVLERAGRGHSAEDTVAAMAILKKNRYETGLQIMPGLPFDTEDSIMETTSRIIELNPDFVRIYPTIALKGSGLEKMIFNGAYSPLKLDAAVNVVKKMYLGFLMNKIPVIRMGLQSSQDFDSGDEIVEGPYHPAFGHLVFSSIFLDMAILAIGKCNRVEEELTIYVNPGDISKMRGINNNNISVLIEEFNFLKVKIVKDDSLEKDSVKVQDKTIDMTYLFNII